MNYYKYQDEDSLIDGGVSYIEVADGVVYRQIIVNGERFIMSNIKYMEWGLMMAEGKYDYSEVDEVEEISRTEFDDVWDTHLAYHQEQWNETKQKFKIGTEVIGYIQIFYPQGVIIHLDEKSLGVADYAECKASAKPEWMYPGFQVIASVKNYDEINHWLVLGKPKVHNKRIIDYRVN